MKRFLTIMILLAVSRYVGKEVASTVRQNRMNERIAAQKAKDVRALIRPRTTRIDERVIEWEQRRREQQSGRTETTSAGSGTRSTDGRSAGSAARNRDLSAWKTSRR